MPMEPGRYAIINNTSANYLWVSSIPARQLKLYSIREFDDTSVTHAEEGTWWLHERTNNEYLIKNYGSGLYLAPVVSDDPDSWGLSLSPEPTVWKLDLYSTWGSNRVQGGRVYCNLPGFPEMSLKRCDPNSGVAPKVFLEAERDSFQWYFWPRNGEPPGSSPVNAPQALAAKNEHIQSLRAQLADKASQIEAKDHQLAENQIIIKEKNDRLVDLEDHLTMMGRSDLSEPIIVTLHRDN